MRHRYYVQLVIVVAICFGLSGCMVGPDFLYPAAPPVSTYTYPPQPKKTVATPAAKQAGASQEFFYGHNLRADWWRMFRSPELDHLIEIGLVNSPNLNEAQYALCQAQELLNVQIGSTMLPNVSGTFSATRQRVPTVGTGASSIASSSSVTNTSALSGTSGISGGSASGAIFNLYNAAVNVSYTLDVFGGARRNIEAFQAQVDNAQFLYLAAYLTLTSNIVTTAITMASLEAQIKATKDLIRFQANQYQILLKQFELGGIGRSTVLTQETLLEQTRASLPPLEKSLAQNRHALAVLLGLFPNEPIPTITLESLHLPTDLPVSLPSCLVRQRPDIRATEALLHQASAEIGVATANLFPSITLNGTYGYVSTVFPKLFSPANNYWTISGTLLAPIFNGGALVAQRRAAIANFNQVFEQYRQAVLTGFQNVADSLRALEYDARTLKAHKQAEIASREALKLVEDQYRLGGVSYLALLIAQIQYEQALINRIQSQALRYNDTVALFQSLGGGWWNLECAPCVETGEGMVFSKTKCVRRLS